MARYEGAVGKADLFGDQAAGAQGAQERHQGPAQHPARGHRPAQRRRRRRWPTRSWCCTCRRSWTGPTSSRCRATSSWTIPPFSKADFHGGTDRSSTRRCRTAAGCRGGNPDAARGFELLATTVQNVTGIKRFDAGAIINFSGFKKIVDAMGGVDMYIERRSASPSTASRTASHRQGQRPTARATSARRRSTRRATSTSAAGRRSTTSGSATRRTASRTATTAGSGTSSSSSRPWPARRSAPTW